MQHGKHYLTLVRMMFRRLPVILIVFLLLSISARGQVTSEWRGPARSGVYADTGLLKKWPEKGPHLIMLVTGLPKGNSSVAAGKDALYIAGTRDSVEILTAIDMKGNKLWETAYGRAWSEAFPESRSTPTIENERVYVASGKLDAACIDARSGKIIWYQKVMDKFQGAYGRWGTACSPLIVDNKIILTTGGNQTTVVALDKLTGKIVWSTASLHDNVDYVSPCLIDHKNRKQIIAMTEKFILGISPLDGKIIWTFDYSKFAGPDGKNNNATTPLYANGRLYITSGYDHYSVMLALSDDGNSVSLVWKENVLDNHLGGVVHVGNYIYGSNWINNNNGNWVCIDWETGKLMFEAKWGNKGAIISAEGMLYCYEEKSGNVGLVKANSEKFDLISSFKIAYGSGPIGHIQ